MDNSPPGNIIIFAASQGTALLGLNQDNPGAAPAALTVHPAGKGRRGMVTFAAAGEFESGMNRKGLVIALSPAPAAGEGPGDGPGWLEILGSCNTVVDVIGFFNGDRLHLLGSGRVFAADRSGDAAVLRVGDDMQLSVTRVEGWFLVHSASTPIQPVGSGQADYRCQAAQGMLAETGTASLRCFRDILSVTHSEGAYATVYSIIYDLVRKDVYLYHFHDFSRGIKFNLLKALKKESAGRTLNLASLFPIRHAYYAQTCREEAAQVEAPAPVEEKPAPRPAFKRSHKKASLSAIKGIGAVYENKLKEIGIHSVASLLNAGATPRGRLELSQRSGISDGLILAWINRADLCRIHGIGNEYADLLELAGVDTVPELAQRNPGNLLQRLLEINREKSVVRVMPSEGQVAEWISQAKDLLRIVFY